MIHRLRGAIWLIGAVALPLVALILLLSLVDDSVDALDAPPSPLSVPTEATPLDLSIEAVVVVEFSDEIMIRAPENWNGLVTSVDVAPGQDVLSGSPVLSINGVRRLAIRTPAPFYRSLARRDKGPDVAMLQEVLRDLRVFEGESDGLYGSETERGVNVLSKMLGADNKAFDPSWFVWLPAASVTVGRVDIQVGDSAPVSGAPLLITERSVVRIAIEAPTNPVPVISGFTFNSQGSRTANVDWQSDRWTIADTYDALRSTLELDPGSAEDLLVFEGRLTPRDEISTIQVPSSAVMSGASGNVCVWIPQSGGWEPIDVEVVWSTPFGQSQLAPGLSLDTVLGNPREYLGGDAVCP